MARASTFTTKLRTELDASTRTAYSQLEAVAGRTYDNIARKAANATKTSASVRPGAAAGAGAAAAQAAERQLASLSRTQALAAGVSVQYATKARTAVASTKALSTEAAAAQKSLDAIGRTLSIVQGPLGPLAGRVTAVKNALTEMTGVGLGVAGLGATIFAFAGAANKFVEIESKLRPLYETQAEVNKAMQANIKISTEARTSLAATADLYAKLTAAGREFGVEQSRINKIVEIASKASTLSGGTAQSREAGLYQLAQGLQSGILAGDELKSLRENLPVLARTIAQGLGVGIGDLKKLGEDGKLTIDVVLDAIEKGADNIDKQFGRLPKTLSSASQEFSNAFTTLVGRTDQAVGVTSTLAESLSFVANNLRVVIDLAAGLAAAFAAPTIVNYGAALAKTTGTFVALNRAAADGNVTLLNQKSIIAAKAKTEAEATKTAASAAKQNEQALRGQVAALKERQAALQRAVPAMQKEADALKRAAQTQAGLVASGQGVASGGLQQQSSAATLAAARARGELTKTSLQLTRAEQQLAGAVVITRTSAETAAKATAAYSTAQAAATLGARAFAGAMTLLKAAIPVLAITALVTVLVDLATRESEAERNARTLADAQEKLGSAVDFATGKIREQNEAKIAGLRLDAGKAVQAGVANYNAARGAAISGVRNELISSARASGAVSDRLEGIQIDRRKLSPQQLEAGRILGLYGQNKLPGGISELTKQLNALAAKDKNLKGAADAINELGTNVVDSARAAQVAQGQAQLLAGNNNPYNRARAQGQFDSALSVRGRADGKPKTKAQLEAEARAAVAESPLEKAQASLAAVRASYRTGMTPAEEADYARRLNEAVKAVDDARDAEKALRAERAAGRHEAAERRKEERAYQKMLEDTARRTEELTDLRARYDSEPRAIDRARDDARRLQNLVGQTVNDVAPKTKSNPLGRGLYTQEMADADRGRIAQGLKKPFEDILKDYEREQQIQELILQGRDAEAQALKEKFALVDAVGRLEKGQYQQLVDAAQRQIEMNDALADRQRIVDVLQGSVDAVKGSVEQFLNDLPGGAAKASGNLLKNLARDFRQGANRIAVENLFGGVDRKVRDLISGRTALQTATEFNSQALTIAGSNTQTFGQYVSEASDTVESFASVLSDAADTIRSAAEGATSTGGGAAGTAQALASAKRGDFIKTMDGVIAGLADQVAAETDIVVPGRAPGAVGRAPPKSPPKVPSLRETYNEVGKSIGDKLDKVLGTKFLGNLGNKLGDALQGAGKGAIASGVARSIGIKQSNTGAQIGGAIGGLIPQLGPLGPFIGGLIGGTLGGLLKKTKTGSATVGGNQFGGLAVTGTGGNSQSRIKTSTTAANSLIGAVETIAEQLGGTINAAAGSVSIGVRDKNFRVDPTGSGNTKTKRGAIDFGDDQQAAIEFAIKNLIQDGVIGGISQASQNIIRSGQDLQRAIEKASLIEAIPRKLKAIEHPVESAVDDLNREYAKVIEALKEGGATAAQFADAQKLYDIERARAIKEAQDAATGAIDRYLKDVLNGQNSPLNKATVYQNASTSLNKFASDVNAGKVVDQNDLVDAVQNFQEASRALNGSSQAFFSDFDMLTALLEKARTNAGVSTSTDPASLPASPFDTPDIQRILGQNTDRQVNAIDAQTQALLAAIGQLTGLVAQQPGGSGAGSSIGYLPGFASGGRTSYLYNNEREK